MKSGLIVFGEILSWQSNKWTVMKTTSLVVKKRHLSNQRAKGQVLKHHLGSTCARACLITNHTIHKDELLNIQLTTLLTKSLFRSLVPFLKNCQTFIRIQPNHTYLLIGWKGIIQIAYYMCQKTLGLPVKNIWSSWTLFMMGEDDCALVGLRWNCYLVGTRAVTKQETL